MLNLLLSPLNGLRASRVRSTSRNRAALAEIPAALYPYWQRTAHTEFEGIPRDAFFFTCASDALMTFFGCVRHSGKPCALPSKAADSVWHAWLAMAPDSLDAFCLRHFGQRIPHVQAAAMPAPMSQALANCLVEARRREGIAPEGPQLPKLFAADRRLRMPDGFAYSVVKGAVVLAPMDWRGRPRPGDDMLPALAPAALLAAGLIGQHDYLRYEEAQRKMHNSCGSTGSSCGSVSCDGDGGGGDGGSCGGGCGGGGD